MAVKIPAAEAAAAARVQRAREVENALASVRMEGLEPTDEAKTLFQRYVEGDLTSEELGPAIDRLLDERFRRRSSTNDRKSVQP